MALLKICVFLCLVNIKGSFLKSGQWSPLCAHLRFLLLGQRHPSVRCSSEASHGGTSSKRVQLSWQDSWELISDLAEESCTLLSPVPFFAFTSHKVTPALSNASAVKWNVNMFSKLSAMETIYNAWQTEWDMFLRAFQISELQKTKAVKNYTTDFHSLMTEIIKCCIPPPQTNRSCKKMTQLFQSQQTKW